MSNWSDLKASVSSIIKTNGAQEITGQLLQNVLNNIISNVGLNSTFAGIATPETNPGTPDGNVFYLATTAGTYSNFNGIVINSGEAVILEWRGTWVKKDSGFATQKKLSELGSELRKSINNEKIRAKEAEEELENSINTNRYGYNVTVNGLKGGIHTIETAIKDVPSKFRMLGQKIIFRTENGDWATYHNESLSLDNYENVNDWVQEVGISSVTGDVNITNAPDYEDLTEAKDGTIKFADKEFNKDSFSGFGRVYLRKNIVEGVNVLTQDMVSKANTIYIIQYDYDLQGAKITVPEGCVLDFQGGSFTNGEITGTNTRIREVLYKIFDLSVNIDGTWNISEIYPEWFGAEGNGVNDDTQYIQKAIYTSRDTIVNNTKLINKYLVSETIYLPLNTGIEGTAKINGFFYNKPQLVATFSNPNSWVIESDTYYKGQRLGYKSGASGGHFDNEEINNCSNIFVKNLFIETTNDVYGGIRFVGSPGYIRENVGVTGVKIGFYANASWCVKDSKLFALASMYGYMAGYDINGLQFSDSYINCSKSEVDMEEDKPNMIYAFSDGDVSDLEKGQRTGIYLYYVNGAVFNNIVTEHWDVGRTYIHAHSIIDNSPYLEGISKALYVAFSSSITINGYVGLNTALELGLNMGTNMNAVLINMGTLSCRVSQWAKSISAFNTNIGKGAKIYYLDKPIITYDCKNSEELATFFSSVQDGYNYDVNLSEDVTYTINYSISSLSRNHITFLGKGKDSTIIKFSSYIQSTYTGLHNIIISSAITLDFSSLTIELADDSVSFSNEDEKGAFFIRSSDSEFIFRDSSIKLHNATLFQIDWERVFHMRFTANNVDITANTGAINNTHYTSGISLHNSLYVDVNTWNVTKTDSIPDDLFSFAYINQYIATSNVSGYKEGTMRYDSANKKMVLWNGTNWMSPDNFPIDGKYCGTTEDRPNVSYYQQGVQYYDQTIGIPIFWQGDKWVSSLGTIAKRTKGSSYNRPTFEEGEKDLAAGTYYFDTTLNKPIWWTGEKWVDATGAEV